jgi:hypothetical protein
MLFSGGEAVDSLGDAEEGGVFGGDTCFIIRNLGFLGLIGPFCGGSNFEKCVPVQKEVAIKIKRFQENSKNSTNILFKSPSILSIKSLGPLSPTNLCISLLVLL